MASTAELLNKGKKEKRCPQGHELAPWTAKRGSCDVCSAVVSEGERVMDCRLCNYYVCNACYPQELLDQGLWGSITWVVENAKMEMSNISSNLSELVPGVSCTNVCMASVEKDEIVITNSSDYDVAPEDQEEQCQLQEPTPVAVDHAAAQPEPEVDTSVAAPEVQQPMGNLLDLDDEPAKPTAAVPAASLAAPPPCVTQDLVDLTDIKPAPEVPAAQETLLLGDLAGLSMGPVATAAPDAQFFDPSMAAPSPAAPCPDLQLLDLSTAAAPVASPAAPSHNDDLLDLNHSWTQPTTTAVTAGGEIPRLDRLPASSCSMAAPQPCEMGHQAAALLA